MDHRDAPSDAVVVLTDAACWDHLGREELGRLVTHVGEVLDIFPVNFIVDGESILFRTGEGSKLVELTINDEVLFEVDGHSATDAWSVVVRGHAERLATTEEIARADGLGLVPWIPTLKYNYVRIVPTTLTGRAFERSGEPERYGIADY